MKARVLFTLKRGGRYYIPNTDSQFIDVNESEYQKLKNIVELVDPEMAPEEPSGWIPEEFPYQHLLVEGGIFTFTDLRKVEDLTEISGIGPATAKKILAAMEEAEDV
jgi:hypothetical protein